MQHLIYLFARRVTCFSLLFMVAFPVFAQFDETADRFEKNVLNIPQAIGDKQACDALIEEFDDLNDAFENYSFEDHTLEQINIIRKMKKYSSALENFLRTVGNHSYMKWTVTEDEMYLAKDLLAFDIVQLYTSKYIS